MTEDFQELRKAKAQCVGDLSEALPRYADRMNAIDPRLMRYIDDALSDNADHANLYELLGIRKVLRLMDSYKLNAKRVQRYLRAIEGIWENGRHVRGGLRFDTPRGNMHVPLMPYQVWCLFGIYGFDTDVAMGREYHENDELLPTEWVKDGEVWDTRRLTQEAHLFQTRKSGKTEFGGAIDFVEVCFLGPANGQALICANSSDQAKIAYKAIKEFAAQVDPTCLNRMGGKYFRLTANEMNWQPGHRMKGEVKVMSAGGKRKDGLYGSVIHADEHGSAEYTNGKSDMQQLVEVCWGSTGPRREKLLLHTTTAGLAKDGPYKDKIQYSVEPSLMRELGYPLGESHRTPDDAWFAFLLQLDKWEITENIAQLNSENLFKKVNRSIGITVQPTYYGERLHEAMNSDDTKKEVLTKDFNIWQDARMKLWMKSERIAVLQIDRRVTDCTLANGWQTFVGMDFSHGDDLFALTYLSVNYVRGNSMAGRFFADMDAWVLESVMKDSPNRALYERWAEQGWLHICPGETFDSTLAMNVLAERTQQGINMVAFGYDPAQSRWPLNTLRAWLYTLGVDTKSIEQMVIPVSQTTMCQTPRITELEHMIYEKEPWINFSMNPMWPWQFGNTGVELTTTDLRRICKGGPQPTHKMDNVAALVDALYCFDLAEGKVTE